MRGFAGDKTTTETSSPVNKEIAKIMVPAKPSRVPRAGLLASLVACVVTLVAAVGATPASASFGLESFDGTTLDSSGKPFTQAGGRPDSFSTTFALRTITDSEGEVLVDGSNLRDAIVDLPAGLVGNPQAVPTCRSADFYTANTAYQIANCPDNTAVGVLTVQFTYQGGLTLEAPTPIFNLAPGPDAPARFGAVLLSVPIVFDASVRTGGDYGLAVSGTNLNQGLQVFGTTVTFWGVPADPSHDSLRGPCVIFGGSCSAGVPPRPFLRLPTACQGPQTTTIRIDSWANPGNFETGSYVSHDNETPPNPVGIEGCEKLSFAPQLSAKPDSTRASSPGGLAVSLHMPQGELTGGLGEADLRKAEVVFPEGVSVNPAAADGLGSCSESDIGLHDGSPANCPESSKIGTTAIKTPLLDDPLRGALYLAKQDDNPFNSLVAVYLVVEGSGVAIKLAGEVSLDANTGQIKATFDNNPQLPFEDLTLNLFGGQSGVLELPADCGTYTTRYELTPWSGTAPVSGQSSFQIDEGCDTGGFDPKLNAGTTNPVAGAHSPFVFDTTRNDGEQNIAGIGVDLPKGLTAKLAGIPLCGDADATSGNCPAGSQVGVVNAAVGAGSSPLWVPQAGKDATAVYLAGPYKGAPYSIVAKVPAQAGPFDLGTVAVRSKIDVDPVTAEVSVQSDSLPQILQGIPISYREVQVNVDKPGFMLNPTSCEATSIGSSISSDAGAIAHPSSRFQVGGCGDLGFSPRLAVRLFGPTKRGGHPRLRAVVSPRAGQANIGRAAVTLPRSEFLDQAHIKTICTRVQFAANNCPAASVYGYAKAWTPLLDQPLQGPVYLRSSNHKLPDLVADLNGQIHIVLGGRIDSVHQGIRTTFEAVPDAPVSRFMLNMQGGKKGLLINSRDICAHKFRATANLKGQNGRSSRTRPLVRNGGCGTQRKHKRHRRNSH